MTNFLTSAVKSLRGILTTKGDILGYSTTEARLPIGADGTVLTADSTQTLGLKWGTSTGKLSLLDSHVASGTESTYTYTPGTALTASDYSKFFIVIRGQMTLAFTLQLVLNGIVTTYQTNGWRNANATTDTNDKVVNGTEYKIHDSSLGGTNADFEALIEIMINGIASNRPSFRSWCNDNTDLTNSRYWGTISGTAVTTITSINIKASTSTWKAGTQIHTYGVTT